MHGMMTPAVKHPETTDERLTPVREGMPWNRGRLAHVPDSIFLLLLLICSGAGLVFAQTSEGLDRGQGIYREHCMECHGATGKGDGVKAPFLSPRPGNLISAATSAKTDKELLRTIAQGKSRTAMPAWQDVLPAEDQQSVLQYIRSLVRFIRPSTPPFAIP